MLCPLSLGESQSAEVNNVGVVLCCMTFVTCLCLVGDRLVTLLVSHSTEVQRVVATLVSDYANTAKAFTLLPQVKVSVHGQLLGICDRSYDDEIKNMYRKKNPLKCVPLDENYHN